ncbi:hypothetical protein VTN96DRAFT_7056 [Rasamsonia emersonii]
MRGGPVVRETAATRQGQGRKTKRKERKKRKDRRKRGGSENPDCGEDSRLALPAQLFPRRQQGAWANRDASRCNARLYLDSTMAHGTLYLHDRISRDLDGCYSDRSMPQ